MSYCRECNGWMSIHEQCNLANQGWYKCRTCGYSEISNEQTSVCAVSDFSSYLTSGTYPRKTNNQEKVENQAVEVLSGDRSVLRSETKKTP